MAAAIQAPAHAGSNTCGMTVSPGTGSYINYDPAQYSIPPSPKVNLCFTVGTVVDGQQLAISPTASGVTYTPVGSTVPTAANPTVCFTPSTKSFVHLDETVTATYGTCELAWTGTVGNEIGGVLDLHTSTGGTQYDPGIYDRTVNYAGYAYTSVNSPLTPGRKELVQGQQYIFRSSGRYSTSDFGTTFAGVQFTLVQGIPGVTLPGSFTSGSGVQTMATAFTIPNTVIPGNYDIIYQTQAGRQLVFNVTVAAAFVADGLRDAEGLDSQTVGSGLPDGQPDSSPTNPGPEQAGTEADAPLIPETR